MSKLSATFEIRGFCNVGGDGTVMPTAQMLEEAIEDALMNELDMTASILVSNLEVTRDDQSGSY